MLLMLKYKGTKFRKLHFFILCTVLEYLALTVSGYILVFEGMVIFLYSAILALLAFLFFEGSPLKKIIISIIPINAFAVGSIFAFNIVSFIYYGPVYKIMTEDSIYRFIAMIIANSVSTLIFAVMVLVSRNQDIELGNREWAFMGIILCLTIITYNMIYNVAFEVDTRQSKLYVALAILGLTAMNIIDYILMISLANKHKLEMDNGRLTQQLYFQEESIKDVKQQYEQLHKVRHDFKNTLEIIKAMSDKSGSAQVTEYINKYEATWDELVHIVSTDNDYVNAILNSKLAIARNSGISPFINIINDIGDKNSMELCSLIGNMFDNAIEACMKCQGDKRIIFEISRKNDMLELLLKNTIHESVLTANPTLATTKKDKDIHGYGTRIIKEVSEKCDGYADFYEKDDMFCCHVVIKA